MLRRTPRTGCRGTTRRAYSNDSLAVLNRCLREEGKDLTAPRNVAILGGGITGLASAYFTALRWPDAKITLFEKSSRLGGWMRSDRFDGVNGGSVVFEQGPRSLRPAKGTLALIIALGLEKDLLVTKKNTPAAKNRYIYFNNKLQLLRPSVNFKEFLSNPLLLDAVYELAGTFFKTSLHEEDESIGDFFRRRGLPNTANNVVSAVMHGIYAGDINELSVNAVLPRLKAYEMYYRSPWGYLMHQVKKSLGIAKELFHRNDPKWLMEATFASENIPRVPGSSKYMAASIYTLKGGLQTLTDALVANLRSNPRITIVTETRAEHIGKGSNDPKSPQASLTVRKLGSDRGAVRSYDRILSTIPSTALAKICAPLKNILGQGSTSTVGVVNLFYAKPNLTPVKGFGYLIPRSIPRESNPEGALGVVFDSDATPDLDTATGTKLTVMLGGPFWKDIKRELLPSSEEAIELAKGVVAAHLGITDKPLLAQANVHMDCIPQYTVGHFARIFVANERLRAEPWSDCVKVAGSSYSGVGVNDCIQSAHFASVSLLHTGLLGGMPQGASYYWHEGKEVFVHAGIYRAALYRNHKR